MATGVRGPAGRIARGPVMVERESVIDFATVRLHSMEARFAKAKEFWKSLAMKNPVPVSMSLLIREMFAPARPALHTAFRVVCFLLYMIASPSPFCNVYNCMYCM